jgi:UDP-2,4-diacetamido-2,4,6-trideoxy-beta-L-altropyranose hydrolase
MVSDVMRLLIRVDGDDQIGAGHVMRCLALADAAVAAGAEVAFVSRSLARGLADKIAAHRFGFYQLFKEEDEPRQVAALAHQLEADWIVLDGYQFSAEYHRGVRVSGRQLLVIDDMASLDFYDAELVVNQNLGAERLTYRCASGCEILTGPRYALLAPEYTARGASERSIPPRAQKILVTLGGADPPNATAAVMRALESLADLTLEVRVVVGPANRHRASLQTLAGQQTGHVELVVDPPGLAGLMRWADLVVAAGGSTCWELACLGLPALIVVIADNQAANARALAEHGAVENLGQFQDLSEERLVAEIRKLVLDPPRRAVMSRRGVELVDGNGARRVVERLHERTLRLRSVEAGDARLLFDWVNDPQVRTMSFASESIAWDEHRAWFEARLTDPNHRMFIATAGADIGLVRFALDKNEAVISLSIAREHRGRKLSVRLVRMASARLFCTTDLRLIHAYIKPENEASRRAFSQAGFSERPATTVRGQPALHFCLAR